MKGNYIHGGSYTRLYGIWSTMKTRCTNPNNAKFYRYGKRGISFCDSWRTFEAFQKWALANGYHEGLSLERKDNNGNYCPENCRWATQKEQQNNRSNTIFIRHDGETHTLSEWAEITGIPRTAMWKRIYQRNWSVDKALTTPLQKNYYYKGEN